MNVHHKFPFHFVVLLGRPDLELDERNLFTIGETKQHHLLIGHLGNFRSYNPDLERWLALSRDVADIRSMPQYKEAVRLRPRRFELMSKVEKDTLRDELDRLMPKVKL